MKNYEKPMLEVVSFQEEEKLMLVDRETRDGSSLNGIIGYSLYSGRESV